MKTVRKTVKKKKWARQRELWKGDERRKRGGGATKRVTQSKRGIEREGQAEREWTTKREIQWKWQRERERAWWRAKERAVDETWLNLTLPHDSLYLSLSLCLSLSLSWSLSVSLSWLNLTLPRCSLCSGLQHGALSRVLPAPKCFNCDDVNSATSVSRPPTLNQH